MKIRRYLIQVWMLCAVVLLLSPALVRAQSGSGDDYEYSINTSNANTIAEIPLTTHGRCSTSRHGERDIAGGQYHLALRLGCYRWRAAPQHRRKTGISVENTPTRGAS